MTAVTKHDDATMGVVTLVGHPRGAVYPCPIKEARFLLSPDGRSVDRIKLECEWEHSEVYSISLDRGEGNQFNGEFQRVEKGSMRPVSEGRISCSLFDSASASALLLGTSVWTDSGDYEFDWKADLKQIQRLPYEEWND